MVFVVQKVGRKTYLVRNKFSGVTRAERSSHSEAQRLAHQLNRRQEIVGAEQARVEPTRRDMR
jgi:hypothetical protein